MLSVELPESFHKISVLGKDSIAIGSHLTEFIAHDLIHNVFSSTFVVITDSNIAPLHLDSLLLSLKNELEKESKNAKLLHYIVQPGETSKNRSTKASIEDWLLDQKCTRDICIIALGGGVVGDLSGTF